MPRSWEAGWTRRSLLSLLRPSRRALLETRARRRRRPIELGLFDDEEDAARAYDAALVKYRNAPTVNFPGEAPLAEVLAALPAAPPPPPSADELQLRRELQQLRRENKRLKTTARGGNWTVTSTYYTGDNWTVPSLQSRRTSRAPEHRRLRDPRGTA